MRSCSISFHIIHVDLHLFVYHWVTYYFYRWFYHVLVESIIIMTDHINEGISLLAEAGEVAEAVAMEVEGGAEILREIRGEREENREREERQKTRKEEKEERKWDEEEDEMDEDIIDNDVKEKGYIGFVFDRVKLNTIYRSTDEKMDTKEFQLFPT